MEDILETRWAHEDILETRWAHEDTLKAYNPYREMFREASARAVREVFGQYVKPADRIIEIGSGLGELVRLAPEYSGQIQQTEQSPKIAKGNRAFNPDSNVKVANVYALPFKDGEFSTATGYSVFDTLAHLEEALKEVGRVLIPNGRFIHFLDLKACPNTIFHRYASQDAVLFPFYELDREDNLMHGRGVQLVDKKDLQKVRNHFISQSRRLAGWFDAYVRDPELMYTVGANHPEYSILLRIASDFVKASGVNSRLIRLTEDFSANLERSLAESGYIILESGKREGIAVVQRAGRYNNSPQFNVFCNDVGEDRSRMDTKLISELGDNVQVISRLYVTVAQKTC